MKYIAAGIVMGLLFFLTSCKKENSNPANDQDGSGVIFPLNNGNYWIYKHTLFDTLGNITDTWTDTTTIVNSRMIDSATWYSDGAGSYLFANRADGLYMRDTLNPSVAPQLLYKYPGLAGYIWRNELRNDTTTILSITNRIAVLGSTYIFYKYRTSMSSGHNDISAIPGLGVVYKDLFIKSAGSGIIYKSGRIEIIGYYLH